MPNLIIHLLSNVVLIGGVYYYEKFIRRRPPNLKFISTLIFASNLIDLDHLLANPVYDPNRCGINLHPLHNWILFPFYFFGSVWGRYKYLFWGVSMHLILDFFDCFI